MSSNTEESSTFDSKQTQNMLYPKILEMETIGDTTDYMMDIWKKNKHIPLYQKEIKANLKIIETIIKIQYSECVKHLDVFLYGIDPRFMPGNQDIPFAIDLRDVLRGDIKEYKKNNEIFIGRQLIISRLGDFEISKGSMCNPSKIDFQQIQSKIKKELKLDKLDIVNLRVHGDMIKLKLPYNFRMYPYCNIRDYISFPDKVEPIQKYKDYVNT